MMESLDCLEDEVRFADGFAPADFDRAVFDAMRVALAARDPSEREFLEVSICLEWDEYIIESEPRIRKADEDAIYAAIEIAGVFPRQPGPESRTYTLGTEGLGATLAAAAMAGIVGDAAKAAERLHAFLWRHRRYKRAKDHRAALPAAVAEAMA